MDAWTGERGDRKRGNQIGLYFLSSHLQVLIPLPDPLRFPQQDLSLLHQRQRDCEIALLVYQLDFVHLERGQEMRLRSHSAMTSKKFPDFWTHSPCRSSSILSSAFGLPPSYPVQKSYLIGPQEGGVRGGIVVRIPSCDSFYLKWGTALGQSLIGWDFILWGTPSSVLMGASAQA